MTQFIHLRTHTEYSLIDGIVRIKPLIKTCKTYHMSAIGISDHVNLFGAVKFYKAAIREGIKPIIGADLFLHNSQNTSEHFLFTLFCQNLKGYRNLTHLISRAYTERQDLNTPTIQKEWLKGYTEGLIALSGGKQGNIGHALINGKEDVKVLLKDWLELFPERFYLEVQRTGREGDEEYLLKTVEFAQEHQVPLVATNDVRFLKEEDYTAHEARVCIQRGNVLNDPNRPKKYSEQQYLRSSEEMSVLFSDLPEALENTLEISKRCSFAFEIGKTFLPRSPIPEGWTAEDFLIAKSREGLKNRELNAKEYQDRLETELKVINSMGFAGYFLIVSDFIRWAKEKNIPVGPGRGSGAGSLVAYALNITDLDPLRYDLLFERFLNPERISLPDFDIDFCMEGRDRVIEYVADRYGKESVSQIITYGSMAAKAVVRDVGRVLGYSYSFVDTIAKLIPFELGMTLEKALGQEEDLRRRYETEEEVKALIDLAQKLEGIARNAGKHAGGVVISPTTLTDFMPLYCEAGEHAVTQFDKDDVETIGLVKFDFLGLRTLTIIDQALRFINEPSLDISKIPLNDPETFNLLKSNSTTAVFQLESRGMKDLVKRLQPDCFEDIIALVALFRPGPLQSGMVDDFVDRKHGRARVEYLHPALEPILKETYGIILYQEQVMQIAQTLAGFTLGAADLLRRAMGKKKHDEMANQRAIFVMGAKLRSVSEPIAMMIFDLMEKFAGYGFNKSHSAAYALIAYQTAWLKAHFPAEFMAAVLSSDMDKTDKVVGFVDECKSMKLVIQPPHINQSVYHFNVTKEGEIIYGLGAIKGVGASAVSCIVEERQRNGIYSDLFDFCNRVDLRKINRRVIESLIRSGAMDCLGAHRAALFASLDKAIQKAEQHLNNTTLGQADLFGEDTMNNLPDYVDVIEWSIEEKFLGEKETLGLYLSGHPLENFQKEFARLNIISIAELNVSKKQAVWVAGIISALRILFNKRGERMAFITLSDQSGRVELVLFSEAFQKYKEFLIKDQIVIVEGEVSRDDFTGGFRMSSRQIFNLEQARSTLARRLLIKIDHQHANELFMQKLKETLAPFQNGKCPVWIDYQKSDASAQLALGQQWQVHLKENLLQTLNELIGKENICVEY